LSVEFYNKHGNPFRPYQYLMRDHMVRVPKSAVWAFMGAGKTAATLTALDELQFSGLIDGPVLILAPLRVARQVWPVEPQNWPHLEHLTVSPILGSAPERREALHRKADLYTMNYENLEWLITELAGRWPFRAVVLDESTKVKSLRANIRKNADNTTWIQGVGGKRAKSLLTALYKYNVPRIIELTGTPAPNGLQDLWGQAFLLDYGRRLGRSYDAFKQRWFQPNFTGWGMGPKPGAQEQIQHALHDLCLSLKSEDWFDLEKPIIRTIKVQLPERARKQYREMERQLFTEIQGHPIEAFNAGARTQKCLQLASGVAYLGRPDDPGPRQWVEVHDEKLSALEELVEESAGMPILVAYHFKVDLERLRKRFPDGRPLDTRERTVQEWNEGKFPLLFAHPASAGHGLNLQRGSNILVDFTCSWNAEEHDQILERIGPVRQLQAGLARNVYRYHIVAEDTLDEEVLEALASKRSVQDVLLDAMRKRG